VSTDATVLLPARIRDVIRVAPDGCWLWTGLLDREGYGRVWYGGRVRGVHRVVYELLKGPIPDGLTLDHLCRNRSCVNPAHLEPVTNAENVLRGVGPTAVNSRKTHCKNGHEFTPDNTRFHLQRGTRECLTCKRALSRAWEAARKRSAA
jgi:hypothetical protein